MNGTELKSSGKGSYIWLPKKLDYALCKEESPLSGNMKFYLDSAVLESPMSLEECLSLSGHGDVDVEEEACPGELPLPPRPHEAEGSSGEVYSYDVLLIRHQPE